MFKEVLEKLKQNRQSEKIKMKDMNMTEKWEYIWEYYKAFILGCLFLLFFVGSIINSKYINPPPMPFSTLAFVDRPVLDSQANDLTDRLNDSLIPDLNTRKKIQIMNQIFNFDLDDQMMVMATQQRLLSMVTAKELDILFTDYDNFMGLIDMDYFYSLEGLGLNVSEDRFIYASTSERPENTIYGINIAGNALLESCGIDTENLYMGIMINTMLLDNTVLTVNDILKDLY